MVESPIPFPSLGVAQRLGCHQEPGPCLHSGAPTPTAVWHVTCLWLKSYSHDNKKLFDVHRAEYCYSSHPLPLSGENFSGIFAMKKKRTLTPRCPLNLREHLNDWGARCSWATQGRGKLNFKRQEVAQGNLQFAASQNQNGLGWKRPLEFIPTSRLPCPSSISYSRLCRTISSQVWKPPRTETPQPP